MSIKNYREPNVYSTVKRKQPRIPTTIVDMYPLVIGTGAENYPSETVIDDYTVTASSGAPTVITLKDLTGDDQVVSIAVFEGANEIKNATFTKNADSGVWQVTIPAGGLAEGETTVNITANLLNPAQFTLQRFTGTEAIEEFYGPKYYDGKINNISLGAQIALDAGSPVVYVLQVKSAANLKDRKSTRLNSSHKSLSRMPSSA